MYFLLLSLMMACKEAPKSSSPSTPGPNETDSTDTGTDTSTDVPCTSTVLSLIPTDGSLNVDPTTPITATFSGPVAEATLELEGVDGQVLLAGDGLSAVFYPSTPLEFGLSYTAHASVCDSQLSSTFSTRGPVVTEDLDGRTYRLNMEGSDVTWIAPAGLGPFIVSNLITKDLLMMVQSDDGGLIKAVGSAAIVDNTGLHQYVCTEAIDFPETDFSANPVFNVGPTDAMIIATGYIVPLFDLSIAGTFTIDGTSIENMLVSALADTRYISRQLGFDVCGIFPCESCPDGNNSCTELIIQDANAPWEQGLRIDPNVNPGSYPECH